MKDIEIAKEIELEKIDKVAKEYGIAEEDILPYGKYKAKISSEFIRKIEDHTDGKLILVTSINPTPLGEGKTTVAIGLSDAFNRIGKKSVLALREPSLGPVFGIKGGATGGGYAQVAPMEDINLHFTGDIHAITSANNLLSAVIDNHIFYGNELGFKKVVWKRCLDLNDRALRTVEIGLSKEKNMLPREDGFDITVASEIMAIFCLSKDLDDLKRRIGNIIVGYNEENKPITVKDLKVEGALTVLLKDALNPNIVQTLEHNLAIIHGGPFANIAHGCNSIIATKLALKLGEFAVTEAGFGADLGAEKFINIKCRKSGLKPEVAVCVATLKALKYHGGALVDACMEENLEALENGIENLLRHIHNIKQNYGIQPIVAINQYESDSKKEIEFLEKKLREMEIPISLTEVWRKGGEGAIDLANKIISLIEKREQNDHMNNISDNKNFASHTKCSKMMQDTCPIKFIYEDNDDIQTKVKKVATQIYGAQDVTYSEEALQQIQQIESLGFRRFPVCIAKTQYSFSDNPKNLRCEEAFHIHISEVFVKAGAEFIVVKAGKIFTMPGLPRVPAAENIDINEKGEIIGIF